MPPMLSCKEAYTVRDRRENKNDCASSVTERQPLAVYIRVGRGRLGRHLLGTDITRMMLHCILEPPLELSQAILLNRYNYMTDRFHWEYKGRLFGDLQGCGGSGLIADLALRSPS